MDEATANAPLVSFLSGLSLAVLLGILATWYTLRRKSSSPLPPGPSPLPIFGNTLQFKRKTMPVSITEWSKSFGSVFTVYLGTTPVVIMNTLEALTEGYVTKAADFSDKPVLPSLKYANDCKNISFAPYGKSLKFKRKMAMQALRQYVTGDQNTERVHDIVEMTVENILEEIKAGKTSSSGSVNNGNGNRSCGDGSDQGGLIDLKKHLSFAVINLIHAMCYGYTLGLHSPELGELLSLFESISSAFAGFWEDVFPVLINFPTPKFRRFMRDLDMFNEYINKHIAKEKARLDEHVDTHNLIHTLLVATNQVDETDMETMEETFDDTTILRIMGDLFFAGIDSSRHTLEWVFLIISERTDIQKKMQEEIDAALGNAYIPNRNHRPDLIYVEAVIQETMRLCPPVPLGLTHETSRDTELQGFKIPRKTAILANLYAIQRDQQLWEKPEEFIPERFITVGEDGKRTLARHPGFVPFLVGPRSCIGEFVAKQNVLFLVTGLLRKLEFRLKPGQTQADMEPNPENWFFLSSKPYELMVRPRDHN